MLVKHFDGLHGFWIQLSKACQEDGCQSCVASHHGNSIEHARLGKESCCHGVNVVEE